MKRLVLFLVAMFICLFSEAREVININNGWSFSNNNSFLAKKTTVNLPHTWNSETGRDGNNFYFGAGSYLKEIVVPLSWSEGKRVYIKFNGVSSVATLFINGRYVDTHKGAFTAFTFEISPFLNYGTYNSILVVANNSTNMDVMPLSADRTIYGGINRDVELIITEDNHISLTDYGSEGVYVKQLSVSRERADVEVKVVVNGNIGANVGIRTNIKNGEQLVAQGEASAKVESFGRTEITIPLTIDKPRLWDGVYDPFMYQVDVSMVDNNGKKDVVTVPMGLRFFSIDRDKGFMLNGEPYKLNGVIYIEERAGVGNAMSKVNYEEDIDIIEDMGATAIRMAGAPNDKYVYELCDKKGLIVWSDLPFTSDAMHGGKGFLDSYDFRANGEIQLIEMIRQNYNHPSVVFWGLFDKISTKGDDCTSYVAMLNELAHSESHDRLTVGTSNEDGAINTITDVISWAQYFGWTTGMPIDFSKWSDQFNGNWKNLKPGLGEYGAGANIQHQSSKLSKPAAEGAIHPENWQSYVHEQYISIISKREFLWGSFVNCMFDYTYYTMNYGGMQNICNYGLVTQDRHTKKDSYYAYKANWNTTNPFVHIADRRNYKRESETQNVKVYTNLEDVELFINGISIGNKQVSDGVAEWLSVSFSMGRNTVEARSGSVTDKYEVEVIKAM
ncbi:MAG: glycoside hydrolase family 2 TIM barrel-domain containing protein [Rikenellaceae bacterium]